MDRVQGISLFIRVVETGSFSKAAEDLGITQPTATKFVASMEKRLGALLLHRSTRGVTPTEIGKIYYEKCKLIAREIEEADDLASLMQSKVRGRLTINSSVAFGRRVGTNPWVLVATPQYLEKHSIPKAPEEIRKHLALIYSTVQGDHRWSFTDQSGHSESIEVKGPFTSNNLSSVLSAARAGMGLAALPCYVAHQSMKDGVLRLILEDWTLPSQEIHAVFSSPKHVPTKVVQCIDWLQGQFKGEWWKGLPAGKSE